jgi:hypothetical protein
MSRRQSKGGPELPRNVYPKGTGWRGQRMLRGRNLLTPVQPTPQLARAVLDDMEAAAEGCKVLYLAPSDLITAAIESVEAAQKSLRRALVELHRAPEAVAATQQDLPPPRQAAKAAQ